MKRNLILTFLACGASVLLSTAAQADTATPTPTPSATPSGPDGHKGGGLLAHLTYALDLSSTQAAAIAPILEAAKPQLKQIHEQAKQETDTLLGSVGTQIDPLLSADQQAKLAALLQKIETGPGPGEGHRWHRGFGGGPGGPGGRGGQGGPGGRGDLLPRLTTELGLSPTQQADIKPILEAAHKQVKAIFANTTLTPDQKFTQAKATMEAANSQINGDISTQQQTEFAALKEKFHHHGHGGDEPSPTASPAATP